MPCVSGEGFIYGVLSGFLFLVTLFFAAAFIIACDSKECPTNCLEDCPDCAPLNIYIDWNQRGVWIHGEDKDAILDFTLVDITDPNGPAEIPFEFAMDGGLQ
ncbi:hypothetical protein GLAREA_12118 [Glarea lozoyensis ATCC 20868]|uniref:Uncharacterized protein n=1 Tax=Glarea lozoyensis (strain ATCC 20868 / MF5171) TaxID=1116229 RepID=S3DJ24_GLAL2|nr:uncharacterized protein GLAREA_12118 [Glarea lozoyensis ATCC 20868]EPE32036.1 hypothetical protein GLAREA_12118 [Glarea lozoyensis ATCC 20868]